MLLSQNFHTYITSVLEQNKIRSSTYTQIFLLQLFPQFIVQSEPQPAPPAMWQQSSPHGKISDSGQPALLCHFWHALHSLNTNTNHYVQQDHVDAVMRAPQLAHTTERKPRCHLAPRFSTHCHPLRVGLACSRSPSLSPLHFSRSVIFFRFRFQ